MTGVHMVLRLCLLVAIVTGSTSIAEAQEPSDQLIATAKAAVADAARLRAEGTPDALKAAAAHLERAAMLFHQAGGGDEEADTLVALGDVQQRLSDVRRALQSYERAESLYREHKNVRGQAAALNGLGSIYGRLSDYQKAIESYRNAIPLFREQGDQMGEAAALAGIGAAHVRLNQYQDARDVLNEALPLYQAVGDRSGEATALQSMGYAAFSQDDYAGAIDLYSKGLDLARAAGSRPLEATLVYSIGQTYYHLGEYQRSLNLYREALAAYRAALNKNGEAAALSALGRVYRFLGDYQKALDHHGEALTILRAVGERMNEATTLNNTAHVYLSMGEYRKARPYFEQSLELCRAIGNQSGVASNTNGIGLVHAGLSEYETALPYHEEALRLFRAIGHRRAEADSLGHIGRANQALGRHQHALRYLGEALEIYRAVRVPRQEVDILYALARTKKALGELAEAQSHLDTAIALAEGFRHDVSSQQLRTTYQANLRDLYELKIDVLMRRQKEPDAQRFAASAFEMSERARARGLLDLLAEAQADIRRGVDPSLLERERLLRQRLADQAERQTQLLSAKSTPEQRASITRTIEATSAEHDEVVATIRRSSPRYAALMQPEPLTLEQIQARILDENTVLLEYFLGAERSHLWAVTRESLTTYELPGRTDIERAARRFYDAARSRAAAIEVQAAGRGLSQMVLAPALAQLRGKRVAVIADGALHYVPFAALPDPEALPTTVEAPLVLRHEVVSLPSASTLAILRTEAVDRQTAPNIIAVVADPVFDANDARVRGRTSRPAESLPTPDAQAGLLRSVEDVGLGQGPWPLPRLLGTRREARAILALAPSSKSRQALDFEASRETATDGTLGSYQVIHFATHALINNQHPELSGLVLSLVDDQGRSRDGFLRLNDIYNLRLPAELVVLSACQTGLGKDMRGEGLIGLTRGFMYAGTPRLITSLWQVDDKATSELMGRFYRGLFGDQKRSASSALREAQIQMWREKDWQSVYYWAAFALQGEWR